MWKLLFHLKLSTALLLTIFVIRAQCQAAAQLTSSPAGVISTIAGNGNKGYSGDGGPAINASFGYLSGIAFDSRGNLYLADSGNNVIRRIAADTGIITTVVGTGKSGLGGDDGPAANATLNRPSEIAFDIHGNLFIADSGNQVIREVSSTTAIITTVVGNGFKSKAGVGDYHGDGGPAIAAELNSPKALAFDRTNNLYIADQFNNAVRKVAADTGIITTVAGDGSGAGKLQTFAGETGDDGPASKAQIGTPVSIALDRESNLYIGVMNYGMVRKVSSATGTISTYAGYIYKTQGIFRDNAKATDTYVDPVALAFDKAGDLYLCDLGNFRIRKIARSTGIITTIAGNGQNSSSGDGAAAASASLLWPNNIAFDKAGNLYIVQPYSVRKVALPKH